MSFTRFTTNVQNITPLPDRVQNQAQQLKALFDKAGVDLKTGLNGLMTQLEAQTASENIGADVESVATKTLQAVLEAYETAIANRYTKTETETLVSEDISDLLADFDINLSTGVITITKQDGTTETFDTALEKIPARFDLIESGGSYYLKITNLDGTSSQTDITTLMNIYNFSNSSEVAFTTTGSGNTKTVTASIRANSIGIDKLSLSVISQLEGYVASASSSATAASNSATTATTKASEASSSATTATTKAGEASTSATSASNSASAASGFATTAQSWAVGGTGTRTGENTNNAQYWAGVAQSASAGKVNEPAQEGTNGQVLTTDGHGGRTWTTVQGGGGGEGSAKIFVFTNREDLVTAQAVYDWYKAGKLPVIVFDDGDVATDTYLLYTYEPEYSRDETAVSFLMPEIYRIVDSSTNVYHNVQYGVSIIAEDDTVTSIDWDFSLEINSYLSADATGANYFTPTANGQPATKKYVDAATVSKVDKVTDILKGTSEPGSSTPATYVGQLYINTNNQQIYVCSYINGSTKQWVNLLRTNNFLTMYGFKQVSGSPAINKATDSEIEAKSNQYNAIVPNNLNKAVMEGLGNNSLTWTDTYKGNARTTIGAQETLISGTNLKTINNQSILGSGNIEVGGSETVPASSVTAGTFAGQVVANATAVATLGTPQVRNIYAGTDGLVAGVSVLSTGDIYLQYE